MARPFRIEYPGAFYHVMHRGTAGSAIFESDRDREKFFEYVSKSTERYKLRIHTYCLMKDHYHLLVETPEPNLCRAIKWINVSYAAYFNRKRACFGHLFQGRFRAVLVDAEVYLKQLSRFIHLNPIRSNVIEHIKDYKWSSYPALSGYDTAPEWLQTHELLSMFGKDQTQAKRKYRCFVEKVNLEKLVNPECEVVGGLILGGSDFVTWVKNTFLQKKSAFRKRPHLKDLKHSLSPDDLLSVVCEEFDCNREAILHKGKKRNLARDIAIYLSREMSGESGVFLGGFFGGISGAGITVRYNHIETKIRNDRTLRGQVNRMKKRILNNYDATLGLLSSR
jgi:putative transposase